MDAKDKQDIKVILDVLRLLFKKQRKITGQVSAVYIGDDPAGRGFSYRLEGQSDWKSESRIITVGIIRTGGSKSKCFTAIYDDRMAVVVPPEINDLIQIDEPGQLDHLLFADYLEKIQFGKRIASALAAESDDKSQIPCLIPSVNLIIGKIRPEKVLMNTVGKSREDMDIALLKTNPELRKHLKVGNTYAFFLNLLDVGVFLGNVIKDIHTTIRDKSEKAEVLFSQKLEDALKSVQVTDDSLYKDEFWEEISDLYDEFRRSRPTKQNEKTFRNSFIACIEGMTGAEEDGLNRSAMDESRIFTEKFFKDHLYGRILEKYKQRKTDFVLHNSYPLHIRINIATLIWNLLELITRLKQRKLAIRDLKPDNIFLTKELHTLSGRTTEFIFGLIDLETAVDLKSANNILQPPTIGTPYYSQPTTFFKNEALMEIYGEKFLPDVYYMQDWHAVMTLIYYIVTGAVLFRESVKKLMQAYHNLYESITLEKALRTDLITMSMNYWPHAAEEFTRKLADKKDIIELVKVDVPKAVKVTLLTGVDKAMTRIKERFQKYTAEMDPDQVFQFSRKEAEKLRMQMKGFMPEEGDMMHCLLSMLECVEEEDRYKRLKKDLETESRLISVQDLLQCMFAIEYDFFYPESLRENQYQAFQDTTDGINGLYCDMISDATLRK